ncbi:hypothetical protein CHU93_04100 [Sandarakinorhabdus cyanobacteriorum]|uniref:SGNH hydrolase-type esterase domain-containing protein n=1 Tax=Sandarakinorhabdus cyanobacteriorum TaxID=1981098 RepID=A0A255YRR0_9SPHN|nr:GDSL-type esterase/lipase family protein [Sandarakinorhabdus cyanobacteriorum]OYQ31906.1 hypothetical protein CHU93_04100 [Sandarakinorhabdus cyanobacteriorum]
MARWTMMMAALLAAALPGAAQAQARFQSEQPAPRVDYWQKRAADIGQQLASTPDLRPVRLVFVGDSITDFWHLDANPWLPGRFCGRSVWDESFGGTVPALTALNLGVSGDRIEHVLHRLQPAAEGGAGWLDRSDLQPDVVLVMLGINNSFDAETPADASIGRGIIAVVRRIRERKPQARIMIQSLLPTDDDAKNRAVVQPVNRAMQAFASQMPGVRFIDLYPDFVDSAGRQRRDLFNDGLHPSRDGYRRWRDRLLTVLNPPA